MKKIFYVLVVIFFAACGRVAEPQEEIIFFEEEIEIAEEEIFFEEEIKIPEEEIILEEEEIEIAEEEIIPEEEPEIPEEPEDPTVIAANAIAQIIEMIKIPQGQAGAFDVSIDFYTETLSADANIKMISDGEKIETLSTIKTDLGNIAGKFFSGVEFEFSMYAVIENGEISETKIFVGNEEMRPETTDTFGIAAMLENLNYEKFLLEFLAQDFYFSPEMLEPLYVQVNQGFFVGSQSISIFGIPPELNFLLELLGIDDTESVEAITVLSVRENNPPNFLTTSIFRFIHVEEEEEHGDAYCECVEYIATIDVYFNATNDDVKIILPQKNS
jgi:hypothetical protein